MKLVAIKMIDVLWKNENLEMIKKKKEKEIVFPISQSILFIGHFIDRKFVEFLFCHYKFEIKN